MAVITFDEAVFRAAYPEFSDVTTQTLSGYWDAACVITGINTDVSPVPENVRRVLLNMAVCHLATLAQRGDNISGILTSAHEGSVSSGYAAPPMTARNWWWLQTRCGAAYWEAMKPYRSGGLYFAYRRI